MPGRLAVLAAESPPALPARECTGTQRQSPIELSPPTPPTPTPHTPTLASPTPTHTQQFVILLLQTLQRLVMTDCSLRRFPRGLTQLTNLTHADFRGNHNLMGSQREFAWGAKHGLVVDSADEKEALWNKLGTRWF